MFDLGLDRIWETLTDWIPPQLLTPEMHEWALILIPIAVVGLAAAWFFSPLRPLSGAAALAIGAFLVGMWKGIGYQAARQKQREKAAQAPKPEPFTFKFPWQR